MFTLQNMEKGTKPECMERTFRLPRSLLSLYLVDSVVSLYVDPSLNGPDDDIVDNDM